MAVFLRRAGLFNIPPNVIALAVSGGFGIMLGAATLVSPIIALALIGVLVVGYVVLQAPYSLVYMLLVAIVFTSATERGAFIPILKPNEIVLVLVFGFLFVPQPKHWPKSIILPGMPFAAVAILVIGTALVPLVSYKLRGFALSTSDILSLIAPIQYLCLFSFFALFPRNEAQRHRVIQVMWLLASLVAIIGLLQAARIGPVTSFLTRFYPSDHTDTAVTYSRLTSVFGAWNVLGAFLMSMLVLALALQDYPRSRLYQLNLRLMVLVAVPCLIATNTYANLIGLALSFVLLNVIQPRDLRRFAFILLFVVLAAIALWPFISARLAYQFQSTDGSLLPQTVQYRILVWEKFYIPLILRDPIWGVSPTLENVIFAHAESQYLYMAFQAGIIAVVSHLAWVGLTLGWLFGTMRRGPLLSRNLAAGAFTLLLVYSLMGITNPVFTYSGSMDFFWIVLGLIVNERIWGADAPVEPALSPRPVRSP